MSNTQNIVHRIKTYLSKFQLDFTGDKLDLGVVVAIAIGVLLGVPLIYLYAKQSKEYDEIIIALKSIDERLDKIEKNNGSGQGEIDVTLGKIAEVLGIRDTIYNLGKFTTPYTEFVDNAREIIEICERRKIEGSEYYRTSHMIKFALNMALVYATVRGNVERVPEIKRLLERSKRI